MNQDYLNEKVMEKVRVICDEHDYRVRFFRSASVFRIYAKTFSKINGLILSGSLIRRIAKIDHVRFTSVSYINSEMSATFTIDNLSLVYD